MIWLLPVSRWPQSNAPFVVLFVGWLYVVYFAYRYYAVPRMFRGPSAGLSRPLPLSPSLSL